MEENQHLTSYIWKKGRTQSVNFHVVQEVGIQAAYIFSCIISAYDWYWFKMKDNSQIFTISESNVDDWFKYIGIEYCQESWDMLIESLNRLQQANYINGFHDSINDEYTAIFEVNLNKLEEL